MMTICLASDLAQAAQGFQAADAAHAHVHDDQIGLEAGDEFQAFLAAVGRGQLDVGLVKNAAERILHIRLVID
jgi:hypothetical protein